MDGQTMNATDPAVPFRLKVTGPLCFRPATRPASRKRVYIAGPISKGDLGENIRRAETAFFALARAGFAPCCPHWSAYSTGPVWCEFNLAYLARAEANGGGALGHAEWLAVDLPWLETAHAVLRLPGESIGADLETLHAKRHDIPVYDSLADLIACETENANTGA